MFAAAVGITEKSAVGRFTIEFVASRYNPGRLRECDSVKLFKRFRTSKHAYLSKVNPVEVSLVWLQFQMVEKRKTDPANWFSCAFSRSRYVFLLLDYVAQGQGELEQIVS